MIVFDIETTGLEPELHCMLSLGAVCTKDNDQFYGECCAGAPWLRAPISEQALEVNGFTRKEATDSRKPSPGTIYVEFLDWCHRKEDYLLCGANIAQFDVQFLRRMHVPLTSKWPFGYRYVDLHSIAYAKFGKSLSSDGICKELGIEPEIRPHNALKGALKELEIFEMLVKGE